VKTSLQIIFEITIANIALDCQLSGIAEIVNYET